jgi:hypothetical protein
VVVGRATVRSALAAALAAALANDEGNQVDTGDGHGGMLAQPSQEWRDEARRTQRQRAARADQVGWRPATNLQRGDPRVRARDGTQAGPVLQAPNMPGFNNGPAARRSNVPIVCCGRVMERNSREFRLVKLLVWLDVVGFTIYMLASHESDGSRETRGRAGDGMSLASYALMLSLTMCFGPLLIISPFFVAAICKCWYSRKIEAAVQNSLLAQTAGGQAAAEEARLERMRAEMASSVMSGLRSNGLQANEEVGGYMGHAIVEGELLGDIIMLDAASAEMVAALPVPPIDSASALTFAADPGQSNSGSIRTVRVGGSPAAAGGQHGRESPRAAAGHGSAVSAAAAHGSPRSVYVHAGSASALGWADAVSGADTVSTGRVVQPHDWRLGQVEVEIRPASDEQEHVAVRASSASRL